MDRDPKIRRAQVLVWVFTGVLAAVLAVGTYLNVRGR